jgi:hypothetical protein
MSVVIETFIICDNCYVNFGVDNRSQTAKKHRENAKKDGWTQKGSKDYCDLCSQLKHPLKQRP